MWRYMMKVLHSLFTLDSLKGDQKKAILTWIGAGVINLIMYAISVKGAIISDTNFSNSLLYISLVITTTFAFAMDRRESFIMSNKIFDRFDSTEDLKYIGTSKDALNLLRDNPSKVKRVRNTVYRYIPGVGRDVRNHVPELIDCMREILGNDDAYWIDIAIGPPSTGDNKASINEQEKAINDVYNCLSEKNKQQYEAKKLEINVPLIQLMIIDYSDGSTVITTGYRYLDGDKDMVFKSSNHKVTNYFSDYFESLYKKGTFLYEPDQTTILHRPPKKRRFLDVFRGDPNL